MPEPLWKALSDRVVPDENDERLKGPRMQAGYEMAIAWEGVARLMQYRVVRDARKACELLVYIQAIDQPKKVKLTDTEWEKVMGTPNMSTTGKRMTFLGIFKGMRVRLIYKISARHLLMQDAVGVVVDIEFHPDEFEDYRKDWRRNDEHEAWRRGYVHLEYMPAAVHVKFDGCTVDVGLGEGVVRMLPTSAPWKFKTHDMIGGKKIKRFVEIVRTQFGLFPEKVRTVQTGQGMNMGSLIAMCHKNNGQTDDDVWLHIYVMLSRVRHIDQLLIFAMPDRDMFRASRDQ